MEMHARTHIHTQQALKISFTGYLLENSSKRVYIPSIAESLEATLATWKDLWFSVLIIDYRGCDCW
ncbi:hypothetical protein NC652_038260 [Populus alba x Populus x berolinensis]|uniref:Uncharacterized protein n=1 Tax=Populus alba x Populus x berolinensis TaxID=444605 RepID=A0AAD6LG93_9ROSI|nr:hypothetical protein NC652_038260 [Populus alba x Populus x berolinensis]KAJ6960165.1 hypothetical protein NC653_038261 [Populus alba x Populus x berolinensis]